MEPEYDEPSPWHGIVMLWAFVFYIAAIVGGVIAFYHLK